MTVCLWKGNDVFEVTQANPKGVATLNIHPLNTGQMLLTVSGASANTVSREIEVQ
jgi:hypothetical protein